MSSLDTGTGAEVGAGAGVEVGAGAGVEVGAGAGKRLGPEPEARVAMRARRPVMGAYARGS